MTCFTQKKVDYKKYEEFVGDEHNFSLATSKQYISELISANRKLHHVAGRTAAIVYQYRNLLSFIDDTLERDKKYEEDMKKRLASNNLPLSKDLVLIILHLLGSMNSVFFWVYMMVEGITSDFHLTEEDDEFKEFLCELKEMTETLLRTFKKTSSSKYIPNIKNLQRWRNEDDRKEDTLQNNAECGEEAGKSILDDRNTLQNDDAQCSEESIKFTSDNQNVLENGGVECVEGQDTSVENGIYKGGENECVGNRVTCKRSGKRIEKTLRISSKENLFKNGAVEDRNIYQNISVTCNGSPCSSTLDQPTRTHKNDINRDESETLQNASVTSTSKGPRRYKRKHILNTHESYVNKNNMNENENSVPQNSVPVPKRHRLGRNHYSDTQEINVNGIGERRINTLQNFMSKRSCRSNKYNSSSTHENDLSENGPSRNRKKFKANLSATSETKTEGDMSQVKRKKEGELNQKKQNRRGRKKKNVMLQQEINENLKSPDKNKNILSLEDIPNYDSSSCAIKTAYVALNNVLDDPDAQSYLDVIEFNEKKKKEDVARCREKNEMAEATSSKDRSEMEALQELIVLDDVSDDVSDDEYDNIEGAGRLCNDDQLESDPGIEQEHIVSDADTDQHENDDSDGEVDDHNCRQEIDDRGCHAEHDDGNANDNSCNGTEEPAGPRTPAGVPPESEDDGRSEDGEGSDTSHDNGKEGPSSALQQTKRGPRTPPGNGPDSSVSDDEDANSSD